MSIQDFLSRLPDIKNKPAYDWGVLLGTALIPVVISASSLVSGFQAQQKSERQEQAAKTRAEETRQHEVMTNYLNSMTKLMLRDQLRISKPTDDVAKVARAITLNAARRLDGESKGQMLKFLHEAGLVGKCTPTSPIATSVDRDKDCTNPIFYLEAATLEGATVGDTPPPLSGINLDNSTLNRANLPSIVLPFASLSKARLAGSNLSEANLTGVVAAKAVNLEGVQLQKATLSRAILPGAKVTGGYLRCAKLDHAILKGADLSAAQLNNADLDNAKLGLNEDGREKTNLANADLRGAILTNIDLSSVNLKGAKLEGSIYNKGTTLPPGYTFESSKMLLESDRPSSLKARAEVCDSIKLEPWSSDKEPNQNLFLVPNLLRSFSFPTFLSHQDS